MLRKFLSLNIPSPRAPGRGPRRQRNQPGEYRNVPASASVSFNQGHAGPRQNRRDRAIEYAIDLRRLRKVSNLRGATVVGDGGQQKILHDGPQGYVGTEAIGLAQ